MCIKWVGGEYKTTRTTYAYKIVEKNYSGTYRSSFHPAFRYPQDTQDGFGGFGAGKTVKYRLNVKTTSPYPYIYLYKYLRDAKQSHIRSYRLCIIKVRIPKGTVVREGHARKINAQTVVPLKEVYQF